MKVGKESSVLPPSRDKASNLYARAHSKIRQYCRRQLVPLLCNVSWGRMIVEQYRKYSTDNSVDIFVLSFPKCGRTWLRLMLGKAFALHFGLEVVDLLNLGQMRTTCPSIPSISLSHDDLPQWKTPRELLVAKTEYESKKVILLVRDPRDAVVSNYFQKAKRRRVYEGAVASFLYNRRGSLDTFISFYNIWAERRHIPSDFLLVRYEDMHASAERELRRVLDFIGLSSINDDIIKEATEFACFDNMRKMEEEDTLKSGKLRPKDSGDPESYKTRRGKVGGFGDYLGKGDIEYLNQKINKELSTLYGYQ